MTDEERELFWNLTSCYEGELWEQRQKEKKEQEEKERLLKEQEEQERVSKLGVDAQVQYILEKDKEIIKNVNRIWRKGIATLIGFIAFFVLMSIPETAWIAGCGLFVAFVIWVISG